LRVETEVGKMVMESNGSACDDAVTEMTAVDVNTVLSGFVSVAVIVVVPGLTPATVPADDAGEVVTVAIVGMLELHLTCGEFVTS
jgi:hypothetical protein